MVWQLGGALGIGMNFIRDWPKAPAFYWLWNMHRDLKYAIKWLKIFDEVYKKANTQIKYDCSDFQWTYACWKNQAIKRSTT